MRKINGLKVAKVATKVVAGAAAGAGLFIADAVISTTVGSAVMRVTGNQKLAVGTATVAEAATFATEVNVVVPAIAKGINQGVDKAFDKIAESRQRKAQASPVATKETMETEAEAVEA